MQGHPKCWKRKKHAAIPEGTSSLQEGWNINEEDFQNLLQKDDMTEAWTMLSDYAGQSLTMVKPCKKTWRSSTSLPVVEREIKPQSAGAESKHVMELHKIMARQHHVLTRGYALKTELDKHERAMKRMAKKDERLAKIELDTIEGYVELGAIVLEAQREDQARKDLEFWEKDHKERSESKILYKGEAVPKKQTARRE